MRTKVIGAESHTLPEEDKGSCLIALAIVQEGTENTSTMQDTTVDAEIIMGVQSFTKQERDAIIAGISGQVVLLTRHRLLFSGHSCCNLPHHVSSE